MQPQHEATLTQPLQCDLQRLSCKAQSGNSSHQQHLYIAGTILQLQSRMEFHRQLIHQQHLQSHLHCGNDPTVANHNGIPSATHPPAPLAIPFTLRERSYSCKSQWNSVDRTCTKNRWNPIYNAEPIRAWSEHDPTTHETVSQPSHRRGRSSRFGDGLCMEKHRVSCICYLSKTHFVRDFLQNSIGNSSTSTTCNPIYIAGTILQLQITMEFHRQLIHQHHLQSPFTLRERSYSCKSQWNSIGNSSTSTMHEKHLQSHLHCGNDPTVANHNGILSTAHARKTGETPFTMRNRSEHDPNMIPTTHETVSQPSHRRGRSSRFGDGLCMEKHRVSCICYLSKTHFVRDFLQNSIGNSSTSTTCNPIYIAGTILQLQITMEFHRQLIHQHHLQPHLHCGNDPTVANHNGILSTAHARKTGETPFTMRNRSEHDPNMIRPHTRPSRTRRTAEVDHRGSGTDFVWKNIGFRASAISQKRISCETSFKTPSATPPPAPLAIPFTLRERSIH